MKEGQFKGMDNLQPLTSDVVVASSTGSIRGGWMRSEAMLPADGDNVPESGTPSPIGNAFEFLGVRYGVGKVTTIPTTTVLGAFAVSCGLLPVSLVKQLPTGVSSQLCKWRGWSVGDGFGRLLGCGRRLHNVR